MLNHQNLEDYSFTVSTTLFVVGGGHVGVNITTGAIPSTSTFHVQGTASITGTLTNNALAGTGNRCVQANANGTLATIAGACGSGGGDVMLAGDNTFTGANTFNSSATFNGRVTGLADVYIASGTTQISTDYVVPSCVAGTTITFTADGATWYKVSFAGITATTNNGTVVSATALLDGQRISGTGATYLIQWTGGALGVNARVNDRYFSYIKPSSGSHSICHAFWGSSSDARLIYGDESAWQFAVERIR
jgi:hypothetical protein